MNSILKELYKATLVGAIGVLDVSSNLLSTGRPREEFVHRPKPSVDTDKVRQIVSNIKSEMEEEWDKCNPDAKLLRNFIRGRITTCEDILLRISKFEENF